MWCRLLPKQPSDFEKKNPKDRRPGETDKQYDQWLINLKIKSQKLKDSGVLSKPKFLPVPKIGTKKIRTWFHERKILAERHIMVEKFRKEFNACMDERKTVKKSLYNKLRYWEYQPEKTDLELCNLSPYIWLDHPDQTEIPSLFLNYLITKVVVWMKDSPVIGECNMI